MKITKKELLQIISSVVERESMKQKRQERASELSKKTTPIGVMAYAEKKAKYVAECLSDELTTWKYKRSSNTNYLQELKSAMGKVLPYLKSVSISATCPDDFGNFDPSDILGSEEEEIGRIERAAYCELLLSRALQTAEGKRIGSILRGYKALSDDYDYSGKNSIGFNAPEIEVVKVAADEDY